jgi:hypothetical protein
MNGTLEIILKDNGRVIHVVRLLCFRSGDILKTNYFNNCNNY